MLVTEVLRQAEAGVALPGLGVVRVPAGVGDAVLALLMLVVLLLRPSGVVTLLGHKRGPVERTLPYETRVRQRGHGSFNGQGLLSNQMWKQSATLAQRPILTLR